ncbi:autotransporter outer membrane beta-barrel domain-containing protein [Campylobacter coli]|uniref:autotransporter outer membrane beta-barrel domain-containing protein n=1 Tax=Campylobacter coli TaxID=195 RepID=UPI00403467DD
MKKNASSKILLSLGVATLLYSSAFAQEINLTQSSDIGNYFEENGNDINLKNPDKYKGQDLNIKMGVWDLPNDDYDSADYRLNIDIGKNNTLSFTHNNGQNPAYVTNLNATAKEVKTTDIVLQAFAPSVINGNLTMTSSGAGTITEDEKKGSGIILYNGVEGKSANGSLTINGNFTADKTLFATYGNFVKVNGTANLTNSNFGLMKRSYTDLEANNVVIVQAKDFNENILKANNNAGALLLKFASDYISTDVQGKDPLEAGTIIDISDEDKYGDGEKGLVDYKLSVQNCGGNKCLVINGGATAAAKDKLVQLQVDIDAIDKLLKNEFDSSQGEEWEQAKETLKKQQAELQTMLEEAKKNGGKIDDEKYIDLVNKNLNLNLSANDKASILALRSITEQLGSIGADLASREGVKLALDIKKDTDNTGKSVSNLNSASSAVNTTMNISNDVSIGSRVAMLNNPFGTYASKMNGLKFAALDSDMRPSYVNEYTNSVWANAFGGANIIDGDSGAMYYGATVGVDKQANDNVLWGAYFTYANAKIKDNNLEQKSDNFQLGMYSTINVAPQWELNLKAYAQVSPTKQDNVQIDGAYNSDYTSKFLGLSANAGRVFDFSDNTLFIKPFAGVNYYFSYTPSHTENGAIAKDIDSMKNNSVSVEVGAEFRKYMNENSYIFVTPKIEQFVINSGDDYTANLAVNNAFFTSVEANNKKKTYGQIIVGGNVDFTNQLSMNLGFGAKQILAGKVDNKNETYLSGQVGLKYKF